MIKAAKAIRRFHDKTGMVPKDAYVSSMWRAQETLRQLRQFLTDADYTQTGLRSDDTRASNARHTGLQSTSSLSHTVTSTSNSSQAMTVVENERYLRKKARLVDFGYPEEWNGRQPAGMQGFVRDVIWID